MNKKILISYSMASTFVPTTLDYLKMLGRFFGSHGYEAHYLHVTHGSFFDENLNGFDVVFNSYCARHHADGYVSKSYEKALRGYNGVKIIAIQDEYDNTNRIKQSIRDFAFDIVLTCVPQSSLDYVYPRTEFPHVIFKTVFTGYASDALREARPTPKPLSVRGRYIGYRGRELSARYGKLALDKAQIGRTVKKECRKRAIPCDIDITESSRIYGKAWLDFIEDCRVMLGSESGSNVFDFDGSIQQAFDQLTAENGTPPNHAQFESYTLQRESEIEMGQISPRVFECAALRTPMVLLRGKYSNVLEPDLHYIPLEIDYSNIQSVFEKIKDNDLLTNVSNATYNDLIASGKYTYANLVTEIVDDILKVSKRPAIEAHVNIRHLSTSNPRTTGKHPLHETFTRQPGSREEFRSKQVKAILLTALRPKNTQEGAGSLSSYLSNYASQSKLLRQLWHLLPTIARSFVLAKLRKPS